MITIEIANSVSQILQANKLRALLTRAAQAVLEHQKISPQVQLTIVLSDDSQIQQLNRQYREVDAATDVLSFPADYIDPESGQTYLGDVIISLERAQTQAETSRQTLEDELRLLVVHGVLHLLHYDHAELKEKEEMWEIQDEILVKLGTHRSDF